MKSRGAAENIAHRFSVNTSVDLSDHSDQEIWWEIDSNDTALSIQLLEEQSKSIITKNQSPDVPFEYSINPYRGCEHGCIYCYARPSHAYWDLSPGLDFESKIIYKSNAPELLEKAFNAKNYKVKPICIGANTDCYQPVEKQLKITRKLLQICLDYKHPVTLITKSQVVCRDIDLLSKLTELNFGCD